MAADTPRTSIVIPARNAQATLVRTLDSVRAQTDDAWEALLVDDASTDGTAALMAAAAAGDARFSLQRGRGAGLAAARNTGLTAARGSHLLFLDADDWLAPTHLERLHAALAATPGAATACCDWQRALPDGALAPPRSAAELAAAPQAVLSRTNPLAAHAVLVRRDAVQRAGGFDETLRTCEDWDLWQRLACDASGPWAHVAAPLAFYRTHAGSLSSNSAQLLTDALTVIGRGGADTASAAVAGAYFALWCSTLRAVRTGAVEPLPEALVGLPAGAEHAHDLAMTLFEASWIGHLVLPQRLAAEWPAFGARLTALVNAVWAHDAGQARCVQYALERIVLNHDDLAAPRVLARTIGVRADLRDPPALEPPPTVDRLYAYLGDGPHAVLAVAEAGLLGSWGAAEWHALAARRLGSDALPRRGWRAAWRLAWRGEPPRDDDARHAVVLARLSREQDAGDGEATPADDGAPRPSPLPVPAWRAGDVTAFAAQWPVLREAWPAHGPRIASFDGWNDTIATVAWPALREHGWKAVVFVDAAHLRPGCRALAAEGLCFGLLVGDATAPDTLPTVVLARRLLEDRATLHRATGRAPAAWALARGSVDPRLPALAAECGLARGYGAPSARERRPLDPTLQARVGIAGAIRGEALQAAVLAATADAARQ